MICTMSTRSNLISVKIERIKTTDDGKIVLTNLFSGQNFVWFLKGRACIPKVPSHIDLALISHSHLETYFVAFDFPWWTGGMKIKIIFLVMFGKFSLASFAWFVNNVNVLFLLVSEWCCTKKHSRFFTMKISSSN